MFRTHRRAKLLILAAIVVAAAIAIPTALLSNSGTDWKAYDSALYHRACVEMAQSGNTGPFGAIFALDTSNCRPTISPDNLILEGNGQWYTTRYAKVTYQHAADATHLRVVDWGQPKVYLPATGTRTWSPDFFGGGIDPKQLVPVQVVPPKGVPVSRYIANLVGNLQANRTAWFDPANLFAVADGRYVIGKASVVNYGRPGYRQTGTIARDLGGALLACVPTAAHIRTVNASDMSPGYWREAAPVLVISSNHCISGAVGSVIQLSTASGPPQLFH